MKIVRAKIQSVLGIKYADISLDRPIALFGGPNGAGKSSFKEGLQLAFGEDPERVSLKKEYPQLVHGTAKEGSVHVWTDKGECGIKLPSGEAEENFEAAGGVELSLIRYVLDAQRFSADTPDARRATLFKLMKLSLSAEAIAKRLLARYCDEKKVDAIAPILRAGFEAAQKYAASEATQCKGSWRAVTGRTWGSQVGASWRAEVPAFSGDDAAELTGIDKAIADLEAQLGDAQKRLGIAEHDAKQRHQREATLVHLRETAKKFAEASTLANTAEKELARLQEVLAGLKQRAAGITPGVACECPECGVSLVFHGGKLAVWQQDTEQADAGASIRIPEVEKAIATQERVLARHRANVNEADTAAKQLQALEPPETKGKKDETKPADPETIRQTVETLRGEIATKRQRQDELRKAHAALEAAGPKTKDARRHHADVLAWGAIDDALAPDGIPGDLLSEALKPINDRLRQSATDTGWMQVRIGPDMDITADNRGYRLLSESERWRTDAVIAEAISHLSGLKLLVLDRLDVLDSDGRGDALSWLDILASEKEVDTVIVLGTLKALPAELPETMMGVWVEAGAIVEQKEAVAA